jgi:EAL and modified HD-GYP domain-containing signal transduction protein
MPGIPDTGAHDGLCVARQPILDERGKVFGYELLYRASAQDSAASGSADHASAATVDAALLSVGLETLTSGRRAFFNISRELLVSGAAGLLPSASVVIELLETVPADDETIEACKTLQERGYVLALDDFVPGSPAEAFLPFVHFVKLDLLAMTPDQLKTETARLRARHLRIVAEKVETFGAHDAAKSAGCSLFQGYYFCRPEKFSVRAISSRQLTQMQLIAALNRPNVTAALIEDLVKHDPQLSFRVLRCINSFEFALRREIHSIREAVVMLGLQRIRQWASVWSLAGMNGGSPELVNMTILRARACELLGAKMGVPDWGAEYFLLGLCSLLDAILQQKMDTAIADLPLGAEIRAALLGEPNPARDVLEAVTLFERGSWDDAGAAAARVNLTIGHLQAAFHDALVWARHIEASAKAA